MSDYKDGYVEAYDRYFRELIDLGERLDTGIAFAETYERDEMDEDERPANVKEYDEGYSDGLSRAKARALTALAIELGQNADADAEEDDLCHEKEKRQQ